VTRGTPAARIRPRSLLPSPRRASASEPLEASSVWQDLEGCRPAWVTVPDGPEAFVPEGWPIYAGPDLVYRPDGRRVVILDWKTGDDSDAELQIPLYALYCRTVLGFPFPDEEWVGRMVNLSTGNDTMFEITRLDVVSAAGRVQESVQVMQSLLADADRNTPRPMAEFPLVPSERRNGCSFCPFCPFYPLCERR
jgi:hypothetical protein